MNEIEKDSYGKTQHLQGQKLVMDFSSPNIAKPFSMGHLRATILGDSLSRILEQNGAAVTGINHLGDWGTQFGKLIVAYTKWREKENVDEKRRSRFIGRYYCGCRRACTRGDQR